MSGLSVPEGVLLWQMAMLGGRPWGVIPAPRTEHRFAPPRRWRFDFAWPDHMVAVEVEGGSWVSGRHTTGKGFEADCEKYAEAAILGWRVIRVTPRMIDDGRAIDLVTRVLTT